MEHQSRHENNNNHQPVNGSSLADMRMRNPFGELLKRDITFRRILSSNDAAESSFIEVYQNAFKGAPYHESFSPEFVRAKVWKAHEGHLTIVAEEKGSVIGLVCGHLLSASTISPSACNFVRDRIGPVINERGILYFSELAVSPKHQRLGIGSVLVASALTWASENLIPKFILRTAAEGSNSVGIFTKFGARELGFTQSVASAESGGPESASNKRVYLAGDVTWNGDYLVRLGDRVSGSIISHPSGYCHR